MTNPDTLRAIVATLRDLKADATLEYPGWISVTAGGDFWQFGTANGRWAGDRGTRGDRYVDTTTSTLDAGTDAGTVAGWILSVIDDDDAHSQRGAARLTILIPSAALLGVVLSIVAVL